MVGSLRQLWQQMTVFFPAFRGAVLPLGVALLAGMLIAGGGLLVPLYIRILFDIAYPTRDFGLLVLVSGVSVGTVLLLLVISALRDHVTLLAEQLIQRRLYRQFDTHVLNLPIVALRYLSPGTLTVRFTSDLDQIGGLVVRVLPGLIENGFRLIVLTLFCAWMAPILTLVIWVSVPIQIVVAGMFQDRIGQIQAKAQRLSAGVYDVVQTRMAAIKTIRLSVTQSVEMTKLDRLITALMTNERAGFWAQTGANLASAGIHQFWTAILMVITGALIISRQLTIGEGVAIASYIGLFGAPFQGILTGARQIATATVSVQNVGTILQVPAIPNIAETECNQSRDAAHVLFENVSFAYPGGSPVLTQFSLELKPNTCTVIVGPSGIGKSTILELLLGLIGPQSGSLRIDHYSADELGNRLLLETGVVLQNPYIFSGTIWENLTYGLTRRPSDAELALALQRADCDGWIANLDNGLDTILGTHEVQLSPGQQQRLTIARALLRNPRLLILDEATSALDSAADRTIATTLNALKSTCTIVVVAHRLTALHFADTIAVIGPPGHVIEQGTFRDLLRQRGTFFKLHQLQTGGFDGFLDKLDILVKLAERYTRPLVIITGRITDNIHDKAAEIGLILREVDLIACQDNGDLWIALPETSAEGAQSVLGRLSSEWHVNSARILEYTPGWGIEGVFKAAEGAPHD